MHTIEEHKIAGPRTSWRLAALVLLLCASRATAEDYSVLHDLGRLGGEQYVARRDALLRARSQPWDVEQACMQSWEAGLAAYILNARLMGPESFAQWETEVEQYSRVAHVPSPDHGLRRARVSLAFRLELAWKPPAWVGELRGWPGMNARSGLSPYDAARAEALFPLGTSAGCPEGGSTLWRVLWEDCDLLEFRIVAIHNLACSAGPEDQQEVLRVLLDDQSSFDMRRAALMGYIAKNSPGMVETLVKLANDPHAPEKLASTAVTFLGNTPVRKQENPRAQAALRDIARDPQIREPVRCAALDACARDPRPEDIEIIQDALSQSELTELQMAGIRAANAMGDACLCPALQGVLNDYANLNAVSGATGAILRLCGEDKADLIRAYGDDPAVPEEARQRARSELHRFEAFKREDAEIERLRLEKLRKKGISPD